MINIGHWGRCKPQVGTTQRPEDHSYILYFYFKEKHDLFPCLRFAALKAVSGYWIQMMYTGSDIQLPAGMASVS